MFSGFAGVAFPLALKAFEPLRDTNCQRAAGPSQRDINVVDEYIGLRGISLEDPVNRVWGRCYNSENRTIRHLAREARPT